MQSQPSITFRNIAHSDAIEDHVRRRVDELEGFHPRIVSCDVVIEALPKKKVSGRDFRVQVKLGLPGSDVEVDRHVGRSEASEDVNVAIHAAFDATRRILLEQERKMDGLHVKHHPPVTHGRIDRLFEGEGYGFIVAEDGSEVYFERDNLTKDVWSRLKVDTRVRFRMDEGPKGFYAMNVTATD